jgi:hypothetical protein
MLFVVLSVLSPFPRAASADPLTIRSGYLFVNNDPITGFGIDLNFSGHGFQYLGEAFVEVRDFLEGFSPSSFRLRFSRDEVMDPSSNSSCPGCGYAGDLMLTGLTGDTRFSMTGTLAGFLPGSTVPAFSHDLSGMGTMRASTRSVLYQFESPAAPIPEPATLVLVAGGLAAAVRMRRHRRSRP